MKVLQLRSEFTDNGPGTQALTLSIELRSRGHEVIFCSSGGKLTQRILAEGFKYRFIDDLSFTKRGVLTAIRSVFKLAKVLKEEKVDVVHTHNAASLMLVNIASMIRFKKVKVFQSVHGVEKRENYQWRNAIYRYIRFEKLFAVSEHTKGNLVDFGVKEEKILVTYNGTDLKRFDISKREAYNKEIRDEFSIPYDAKIIGIVGRQDGLKGHKFLVESFKRLYETYPNLYVILVGEGKALERNKKLAEELDITDRCIFVGLRFDVEKFHAAFDIFTLLSLKGYEMFPCVIIEAMAYEKTFVATNTTGVPETAIRGEGFICECEDVDCFVERYKQLLDNEELRISMGKIGRRSVEKIFNIEEVVNKIENSFLGK